MILLVAVAAVGTIALMRAAPGYYTDAGELDAQISGLAREKLASEHAADRSLFATAAASARAWVRGDLGRSRQYDVPVNELLLPRLHATSSLLARSLAVGWIGSLLVAVPLSTFMAGARLGRTGRGLDLFTTLTAAALLAVPAGAMATFCLLSGWGGPVAVLAIAVGARAFKFLDRLLKQGWAAPHLLQAKAQGLSTLRILVAHLLPSLVPELLALVTVSLVTALGAAVPVEVLFNVAGVGQLAWGAAMNRDLPVLLAVTILMALAVALSGLLLPSTDAGMDGSLRRSTRGARPRSAATTELA